MEPQLINSGGTINIEIQTRKIWHSFGTFHLAFSVSSVFWAVVLYHLTYFLDTDNSNGRLPIWKKNRTKIHLTPPCKGCKMPTFVWMTFWLADRLGFYQSSFRKPSCPQRADWWKVEMQFDRWRLKVRFHRIMKIAALFREDLWSASVKSRSQIPLGALTTLAFGKSILDSNTRWKMANWLLSCPLDFFTIQGPTSYQP